MSLFKRLFGGQDPPKQHTFEDVLHSAKNATYRFGDLGKVMRMNIRLPRCIANFDHAEFLRLLRSSLAFSRDEKEHMLRTIPSTAQHHVNEVIGILRSEEAQLIAGSPDGPWVYFENEQKAMADWSSLEHVLSLCDWPRS